MSKEPLGHVEQPDSRTCQSAAIARLIGSQDVFSVRRELEKLAITRGTECGDPYVMGDFLRAKFGDRYHFTDAASLNQLKSALERGCQCITHGWFTSVGHVLGVSGFEEKEGKTLFICEDPWFEFDFLTGRYTNRTGDDVRYSAFGLYAYCVASFSYQGAREIYARRELNSAKGAMWLHIVQF